MLLNIFNNKAQLVYIIFNLDWTENANVNTTLISTCFPFTVDKKRTKFDRVVLADMFKRCVEVQDFI